jgi:Xaa-Pro aminopeptidase
MLQTLRACVLLAAAAALPALPAAAQIPAPAGSPDPYVAPDPGVPAPFSREEFAARRRALAAHMGDGVFVAMGAVEPDADYLPYAQGANFRYLTGVVEAGAVLVMVKRGEEVREHLFVLPRNPARETWEGALLGAEGARRLTGIESHTVDRLEPMLAGWLADASTLYALIPYREAAAIGPWLTPEQQWLIRLRAANPSITRVVSLRDQVRALRAVKSPAEMDRLRRAIHITNLAHREAMRAVEPGMNEFEVHGLIEGSFRRYGAERPAFGTIVGSGPNSTTLHYREADRFMESGDILVMDIGASYDGYAADVTRTVPVNGRFSPEQRQVYEIVLAAQKAAEAEARPGVTMGQLNQIASRILSDGLARLGLIEGPDATYDCAGAGGQVTQCPQFRLYYMHGLGHGIGLDVHDPERGHTTGFAVGSAFTIEPGIYVRGDVLDYLPDTPRNRAMIARIRPATERYRHIGVRIEDGYLLTEAGLERVSAGAPREIDEIEALMARESLWNRERRPEMVEWYRGIHPR